MQFDGDIFRQARVIDASSKGNAVFEFDLQKKFSNSGGESFRNLGIKDLV